MMLTFIQIPGAIMNYRKVIISSFERKQCNKCKVYLLTLDIPEGFLVSSIIVVYSGFKYLIKVFFNKQYSSPGNTSWASESVNAHSERLTVGATK